MLPGKHYNFDSSNKNHLELFFNDDKSEYKNVLQITYSVIDEKIEEYAKRGFPKFSFTFYIPTESRERFKKFVSEYYTMLGFYGSISDKGDFIEVYLSSIKEDSDNETLEEHREEPVNE